MYPDCGTSRIDDVEIACLDSCDIGSVPGAIEKRLGNHIWPQAQKLLDRHKDMRIVLVRATGACRMRNCLGPAMCPAQRISDGIFSASAWAYDAVDILHDGGASCSLYATIIPIFTNRNDMDATFSFCARMNEKLHTGGCGDKQNHGIMIALLSPRELNSAERGGNDSKEDLCVIYRPYGLFSHKRPQSGP